MHEHYVCLSTSMTFLLFAFLFFSQFLYVLMCVHFFIYIKTTGGQGGTSRCTSKDPNRRKYFEKRAGGVSCSSFLLMPRVFMILTETLPPLSADWLFSLFFSISFPSWPGALPLTSIAYRWTGSTNEQARGGSTGKASGGWRAEDALEGSVWSASYDSYNAIGSTEGCDFVHLLSFMYFKNWFY